jgi:hypothetical protein
MNPNQLMEVLAQTKVCGISLRWQQIRL